MASADGGKKKREPSKYIVDITKLKAYIKSKLPNENLNSMGPLAKVSTKLWKDNDEDLEKAKKNLNPDKFLKEYKDAKKESDAKKEAKKANKV